MKRTLKDIECGSVELTLEGDTTCRLMGQEKNGMADEYDCYYKYAWMCTHSEWSDRGRKGKAKMNKL